MRRNNFVFWAVLVLVVILRSERADAQFGTFLRDQAGRFDYYVFSLSWSPEYCAGNPGGGGSTQCNGERRFGFVVHGLWPQHDRGYPQFCRNNSQVNKEVVERLLPIMPSERLIRHQWKKHGTCSGMNSGQYFEKVEDAFALVTIPPLYKNPQDAMSVAPRRLKSDLVAANRNFSDQNFALICKGRFLSEVRVCLDKDLNPRACGREVRDSCRAEKVVLRPVR
ncbi:MAG: ribonuclease T(2) [Deltaproteobacteria bacterium]|nr:ribonuclease T(2) [Deltaproteobacteria bacterium]